MGKKTLKELSAMSAAELRAYFQSLPEAEQKAMDEELNKAIEEVTSRDLVDNLHTNADLRGDDL